MHTNITIQKATPVDVLGIGEVFYKTWLATYPNEEIGITTEDVEFRFKDRKNRDGSKFANIPDNELFLVAKEGDGVVGVCDLIKHHEKNELKAIYILPEYQGRGIGKKFWNEALKFFDLKKDTIVNVVTYNNNAIEFYKRLGFEDLGKRFMDEHFRMESGAIPPEMEMVMPAGKSL
ncbi:MAG: GNAT family N-acetyltransferase [bacterium]